jgi:hypothetical protein
VEEELGAPPERVFARWDPLIAELRDRILEELDYRREASNQSLMAAAFRRSLENAGFLRPHAPLGTQAIVEHLAVFYDTIREPGPLTITGDYASAVVRRFFDLRSPVAGYISIPKSYVILQRINLGLFAVLGQLCATANWRAIAEEIWPFTHGPASTPMGEAEAAWRAQRQANAA